jgi:ribosomal-protein-alanine N-acetyltransferase
MQLGIRTGGYPVMQTERLKMLVVDKGFAERILDYYERNREFLRQWEPLRDDKFYTIAHQRDQIRHDVAEMRAGEGFRFWIFKLEDTSLERPIGLVVANNIIRGIFDSAFLGYKLDKDEINKGYMTEAVGAVVEFAFGHLRLHRLEANVIPDNIASMRVVQKLGFVAEGTARRYLKINGQWQDHIHMVLLNEAVE